MKTPTSDFFQPFLHEPRSMEQQLAAELLLERLEAGLVKEAQKTASKYRSRPPLATAHALENLVLRHPLPDDWAGFIDHEMERKTGQAQALLKEIRQWLTPQQGQPVWVALDAAAEQLRLVYKNRKLPFSGEDLKKMKEALYPAALREFLAQLLGRLTE